MSKDNSLQPIDAIMSVGEDIKQQREKMENYLTAMNRRPHQSRVKDLDEQKAKGRLKKRVLYMDIERIEMLLDEVYLGLWEFIPVGAGTTIVGNQSMVYNGVLRVFHPVAKTWIQRAGVAAVPLQVDKTTGNVYATAAQKAVGTAKSLALKNAAKTLGKKFGRDLNRDNETDYERFYTETPVNE